MTTRCREPQSIVLSAWGVVVEWIRTLLSGSFYTTVEESTKLWCDMSGNRCHMLPLHNPKLKTSGGVVVNTNESDICGIRLLRSLLRVLKHNKNCQQPLFVLKFYNHDGSIVFSWIMFSTWAAITIDAN